MDSHSLATRVRGHSSSSIPPSLFIFWLVSFPDAFFDWSRKPSASSSFSSFITGHRGTSLSMSTVNPASFALISTLCFPMVLAESPKALTLSTGFWSRQEHEKLLESLKALVRLLLFVLQVLLRLASPIKSHHILQQKCFPGISALTLITPFLYTTILDKNKKWTRLLLYTVKIIQLIPAKPTQLVGTLP